MQKLYESNGLYHKGSLDIILESFISDYVRRRYYAACISANYGNLLKYYGRDQSNELENYITRTLQADLQDTEFAVYLDEMMFLILIQAPTQEQADALIGLARSKALHQGFPERKATAGNLAFPFSPSDFSGGAVYEFALYHLTDLPLAFNVEMRVIQ